MFISSSLLALCLTVPHADAASTGNGILLIIGSNDILFRAGAETTPVYGVTAEVESDAGSEEVTFTESDTSLHGAAAIAGLPSVDSRITLTLYDAASASLLSFSGTLGADGSVSVTADADECDGSGKTVCATAPDIEVLAADLFVGVAGGYDVAFDLNGADAYDVAYADIVITESTEVTTCEKGGACTTTGSTTTTEAEVAWDTISAVWEGELSLAHEGVIEIKAQTLDSRGKKIETVKTKLGAPWIDSGTGINALATDEDPLTSVGFSSWDEPMEVPYISIVSEGWSTSTAPVSAQVELTNGKTITIPVNSYQVVAKDNYVVTNPDRKDNFRVVVNGGKLSVNDSTTLTLDDLASPLCADGLCVLLLENDAGEAELSVTAYASTATALPTDASVKITCLDEDGTDVGSEYIYPHFQDDVKAMFANDIKLSADPLGVDIAGKVSLLGAADKKGKQTTLAKGKFYGTFARDADGDLALGGADKDTVSPSGTLLTPGSAIALSDSDGDGNVDGPPVVAAKPASGGPTATEKHGDILIDGVKIDYD